MVAAAVKLDGFWILCSQAPKKVSGMADIETGSCHQIPAKLVRYKFVALIAAKEAKLDVGHFMGDGEGHLVIAGNKTHCARGHGNCDAIKFRSDVIVEVEFNGVGAGLDRSGFDQCCAIGPFNGKRQEAAFPDYWQQRVVNPAFALGDVPIDCNDLVARKQSGMVCHTVGNNSTNYDGIGDTKDTSLGLAKFLRVTGYGVKLRPKTPVDIAATQLSVGDAKFIMNAAQPIELLSENFNGRNAQRCFLTHRRFSRMRRGFRRIGTGSQERQYCREDLET